MEGGKSGQHRTRQLLTTTRGNPRESATETIPPAYPKGAYGKGEMSGVRAHQSGVVMLQRGKP